MENFVLDNVEQHFFRYSMNITESSNKIITKSQTKF